MRTLRLRTAVTAASALVAALSLTACGPDDGGSGAGSAPSASSSASQGAGTGSGSGTSGKNGGNAGSGAPSADQAGDGDGGQGSGGSPDSGSDSDSGGNGTACTSANTKVTVSKVSRPLNHILLTLTNTGSTRCDAYAHPFLRFDESQAPTSVEEKSRPQAVVSVEPGESAYAGVLTSSADGTGADEGFEATSLTVTFADRNGSGEGGTPVTLDLPAETFYVDSVATVTYWQSSLDDALMW
ncbi:DUF4232 domain-containing protein [Streptomyces sp. GC420]|uniref:DUF4232 domain-containing protein n=1 Tax=Streptomyces sp. GC420 TaxID=2697568 RepID=UPI0014150C09|nr:DUF4232 domain-containing protein [Streptomyces sp. GC420]NBM20829.1 DUF4232 domain-containing protein [Streptomyces sp. GC420]